VERATSFTGRFTKIILGMAIPPIAGMNCPFSFGLSLRQLFYRLPDPPGDKVGILCVV
jgi:hypothetical protein